MKLDTLLVHAGAEVDPATGAIAPPLHLSTTYQHTPDGQSTHGHIYIRETNPTQTRLEEALTAVEDGEAALVFASGMAAIASFLQHVEPGGHILMHSDVYTGTRVLARDFIPRWGCEVTHVNMSHLAATTAAVRPNTRVVWLETPSNPGMDLIDIAGVVEIARTVGAEVAVDNTFATPVVQRPLTLGADVVMHSMTKYIGGHSDVQGGALVFRKNDDRVSRIANIRKICGGVLSPFNAWMALRGLRSLGCRVRQQSATALAIAEFLSSHPGVEATHYPGLPSQPGHAIARRQMKGFGGMLSLCVRGGQDEALRVASKLKLFINATSLGGTESLIEHRASVEGPSSVSPKNLLRMSVGLEDPDDLIEDLRQALEDG